MLLKLFTLAVVVATVYGAGELYIFKHPKAIQFKDANELEASVLKEMYSAAMGYSIERNTDWNGMYTKDPFDYPQALCHVAIEGVSTIGPHPDNIQKYSLVTDEDEFTTWRAMNHRVADRHPEENNTLIRVDFSGGLSALDKYHWLSDSDLNVQLQFPESSALQVDVDDDRKFLEEIAVLDAISQRIKLHKNDISETNQDIYWFVFPSLHAISDLHGADSKITQEAQAILQNSLQKLAASMDIAYNGRALVIVASSDALHTRRARNVLQTAEVPSSAPRVEKEDPAQWNLAEDYDENFPVIFNIILWFMVAFIFSLIAVAYVIGTMDPGRDSIIYRMTSNRMKKEN